MLLGRRQMKIGISEYVITVTLWILWISREPPAREARGAGLRGLSSVVDKCGMECGQIDDAEGDVGQRVRAL